ncbi:MAG: hypothetical protein V1896_00230 [Candidatus Zambryskibacteria bacterium]
MDTIIFKVDKKIKEKAQKQAKKGGFSLSDYYRHATVSLAEGDCTVDIVERPRLNAKTIRELLKISRDIKEGKNLSPVFHTVEEMKAYLGK